MPAPGTISTERERALIAVAQATLGSYPSDPLGLSCRNEVVEANMPLAVAIAKRAPDIHMTFDEVKSAGYLGLIDAVLKFDLACTCAATGQPIAFSTYAYWRIRGILSREISVHDRWFGTKLGLHIHSPGVYGINFTDEEWNFDPWSTWEPVLVNDDEPSWNEDHVTTILAAWDESPYLARLAFILRIRYGIGRDEPGTLQDCGNHLGITKERARQLETKAMARFRDDYRNLVERGRMCALPPVHVVNGKAWSA